MEFSTIIIWVLAIHALIAFFISLSVLSCPFRLGGEKLGLFLLTWLIPFIGPFFVKNHLGKLTVSNSSSSGGSTSVDIPPSNESSSGGCSGDSGCD